RFGRQRVARFLRLLFATLVKTHQRLGGGAGSMINGQDIFHSADKVGAFFRRDTPLFFQPGLEFIFFSVVRTVSDETVSTISNSMSFSASIFRLHFSCPSGASLQANCTSRASAAPSST